MRKRHFPASYPLLGLLSFGPGTGYDLQKRSAESLSFFWHEGCAQVYESLEYFVNQGLAELVDAESGKRRKKTYAITPAGLERFKAWLELPVESYAAARHELLVKLFFGRMMNSTVLWMHLERYRLLQVERRKELEGIAASLAAQEPENPDHPFWKAVLRHGIALSGALEDWCEWTERELPMPQGAAAAVYLGTLRRPGNTGRVGGPQI